MTAEFDPYYTWLGIPPEEQPPHHYQLLGIRPLEADREVITHAMDQRMAHLKTLQSGKHSAHSQRLLNEVSAAAVVLLDPAQKGAYDAALGKQLAPAMAPAAPPALPPAAPPVEPPLILPSGQAPAIPRQVIFAAAGIAATVLVLAAVVVAVRSWNRPQTIADNEPEQRTVTVPPVIEPAGTPREKVDSARPAPPEVTATAPASSAATAPTEPNPATKRRVPLARTQRQATENPPEPTLTPEPMPMPPPMPMPMPASPIETTTPDADPDSPPLPTAEQIEAARAKVIEIYGEEGRQAVRPEQKVALAQRMNQVAEETKSDLAVRYALLDTARKLYGAAGEAEPALATAGQMAEEFDGDGWELRLSTSSAMSDVPMPGDKRDRLATALVSLVDQAVAEEQFSAAEEFARLAVKVGNRSADANVRRAVVQKRSELTRHKELWQAVGQAREKLAADPADAAANLIVGKFLCFAVFDFDQGIPHLLASGRDPFAAAARDDQAAAAAATGESEVVVKAGDAWFALAESLRTSDKELVAGAVVRSRHWYQRVFSQLSGLDKARVEKRLQDTNAIAAAAPQPRSDSPSSKGKRGKAKRKGKGKGSALAQVQAGSGLIGRATLDGVDVGMLVTYQPGHSLSPEEIAELEAPFGPGSRQVELLGILSLSADAEVAIHHQGGSTSGGVHYLHVDGKQIHAVGDDRAKDETITLALPRGTHTIRWQLTGGNLGSALLEFSIARSAAKQVPMLEVYYTQQLEAAAHAAGSRLKLDFGP